MKQIKQVRRLDELGRIALPAEVREGFSWQMGDKLEIEVTKDGVFLRKQEKNCMFCGENEGLLQYQKHTVCANCAKALVEMLSAKEM